MRPAVTDEEVDVGLKYAYEKYGVDLDRDRLYLLANEVVRLRNNDEDLAFKEARSMALKNGLSSYCRNNENLFRGYSCALGKIFNARRKYPPALSREERNARRRAKGAANAKKPFPIRIREKGGKRGQYEWGFPLGLRKA